MQRNRSRASVIKERKCDPRSELGQDWQAVDSPEHAAARQRELNIPWAFAAELGRSAVEISRQGFYVNPDGQRVEIEAAVSEACAGKRSIRPEDDLPKFSTPAFRTTGVQVANETTFGASRRLIGNRLHPVALNFANGIFSGGGFLSGARAQEEVLCRSSALFLTLDDDPMYDDRSASMGPPLCSDGNTLMATKTWQTWPLQWGRRFAATEMTPASCDSIVINELQWGRRFAATEMSVGQPVPTGLLELQWGRRFAATEILSSSRAYQADEIASMGPPLCSDGNGDGS